MAGAPVVVVLGALPEELAAYRGLVSDGCWCGARVHLGLTGVGKVAAAAATQRAIDIHRPDALLFTGVAGALAHERRIGELGVVLAAIDAELDIRAWRPGTRRGEHPFTGARLMASDARLAAEALAAPVPGLFPAYVATGSAFLDAAGKAAFRRDVLPELEAEVGGRLRRPDLIEMEGAAVLQVAAANQVPALALRAVSDALEGDAVADFDAFLRAAIGSYVRVVEGLLAGPALAALAAARTASRE